ncbi:MAG TPA: VOC family protein [Gemmatimonadota bacterium]|nr:VOC family protein [Gemmatimonadota bacterium]
MTASSHDPAPNIFPAIKYSDAPAAVDWLTRVLGFEAQMVVPGPDNTVAHAELRLGPGFIMLGSVRPQEKDNPWATEPMGVYVYVEDVQAHHDRARAAGAEIVRPLQVTDYGSWEYSVRDPEGHLWSFGTYRPEEF